jgi:hypothetical protein
VPYVWGEFEVDCRTNEVTGERLDLIDHLTRGWVRAAPGRLVETHWNHAEGVLEANGVADGAGIELLAFFPAATHGEPELAATGLDDVRTETAAGGGVFIRARSTGGSWSLVAAAA